MKNERHIRIESEQKVRRSFMARDLAIPNRSRTFIDRKHEASRRACKSFQLDADNDAEGE